MGKNTGNLAANLCEILKFLLSGNMVQTAVTYVYQKIDADKQKIQSIHRQHIGEIVSQYLSADAGDIPADDEQNEKQKWI